MAFVGTTITEYIVFESSESSDSELPEPTKGELFAMFEDFKAYPELVPTIGDVIRYTSQYDFTIVDTWWSECIIDILIEGTNGLSLDSSSERLIMSLYLLTQYD